VLPYALRKETESSSLGEARFWERANEVNSRPLKGKKLVHEYMERSEVGGGGKGRRGLEEVPNEPDKTFRRGMFF